MSNEIRNNGPLDPPTKVDDVTRSQTSVGDEASLLAALDDMNIITINITNDIQLDADLDNPYSGNIVSLDASPIYFIQGRLGTVNNRNGGKVLLQNATFSNVVTIGGDGFLGGVGGDATHLGGRGGAIFGTNVQGNAGGKGVDGIGGRGGNVYGSGTAGIGVAGSRTVGTNGTVIPLPTTTDVTFNGALSGTVSAGDTVTFALTNVGEVTDVGSKLRFLARAGLTATGKGTMYEYSNETNITLVQATFDVDTKTVTGANVNVTNTSGSTITTAPAGGDFKIKTVSATIGTISTTGVTVTGDSKPEINHLIAEYNGNNGVVFTIKDKDNTYSQQVASITQS